MKLDDSTLLAIEKVESVMASILENEKREVYGMLFPFINRGGKRIRPLLAILSSKAFGADSASVIYPAAIIELFHNFTLIHDDIADDSRFRRGKPTLHVSHGIPIALNSGDALYTIVWRALVNLDMDFGKLRELQKMYADTFKLVVEGQGMELDWYRIKRFDITESEYFDMIGRKTAALIALSCKSGVFLADGSEEMQRALWDFGYKIGTAFQIQDDVLNIIGDFGKYQKEIGGDIAEGKRSLIIVHFLENSTEKEKARMIEILDSDNTSEEDIQEAIRMLKASGSADYAAAVARKMVDEAREIVNRLSDGGGKNALLSVAEYVVSREK
jgi:geranylgeranyl diphosphate synthase type I